MESAFAGSGGRTGDGSCAALHLLTQLGHVATPLRAGNVAPAEAAPCVLRACSVDSVLPPALESPLPRPSSEGVVASVSSAPVRSRLGRRWLHLPLGIGTATPAKAALSDHAIRFGSYRASKRVDGRAFGRREVQSAAEAGPPPFSFVAANKLEETGTLLVPWGCRATGRGAVAGPVEEVSQCEGPVSGSLPRSGRR
jgi:hypothetical protein